MSCTLSEERGFVVFGIRGLGGYFGVRGGDVTGGSRIFIIKYITAYYYADNLKEVEVSDTGWTHNGVDKPTRTYRLREAPTSLIFNNCTLCPHCIYVFCIYLRTNSDLCHLQHKLIGFYSRDEKCLQRGTDWVFK